MSLLVLPNDILVLIINKIKLINLLNLIEAYPSLQNNETLWLKLLSSQSKKHSKYIKRRGTYYSTYLLNLGLKVYQVFIKESGPYYNDRHCFENINMNITHRNKRLVIKNLVTNYILKIIIKDCKNIKHCNCENICDKNDDCKNIVLNYHSSFEIIIKQPLYKYLKESGFNKKDFKLWATFDEKYIDNEQYRKLFKTCKNFIRQFDFHQNNVVEIRADITLRLITIFL